MPSPRYIVAQINPRVGDIAGNLARIVAAAKPYRSDSNALVVFPELAIIGYPPEDLLLRPALIDEAETALQQLASLTKSDLPAMIVGGVLKRDQLLFNAAFLLADGAIHHTHLKSMLPNYGIFDEKRYFAHGSAPVVTEFRGHRLGMLICEDAWHAHNPRLLKAQGAESIVIINASPFEIGKLQKRHELVRNICTTQRLQVVYANMVGGQDDVVFDGASFACSETGEIIFQAEAFQEVTRPCSGIKPVADNEALIWQTLSTGLGDYVRKNGFSKVLLGLSGGIDSAVVAALAADTLGKDNVLACMLPSEFTSHESNTDAKACANALGIETLSIPITQGMDAAGREVIPSLSAFGIHTDQWRQQLSIGGNAQSRLRGLYLMTLSNATGAILLNTSNKSEIAVGYSTLYGDSCGAYSPLKDVYKTLVYRLAAWRNQQGVVIPEAIIRKAPTAELAPNQKDTDQLPEYPVLDAILERLIEQRQSIEEISVDYDATTVEKIYKLLVQSEYKRRQSPPGVKITTAHFGKDWRYPLTNGFKG